MDRSESIIQTIIEYDNEMTDYQEENNFYMVNSTQDAIDSLVQKLITEHGYKDEKAVWEEIGAIRTKKWEEEMEKELEYLEREEKYLRQAREQEEREAEALRIEIEKAKQKIESLKQKQMKQPVKNRIKNKIKKWRGFRI